MTPFHDFNARLHSNANLRLCKYSTSTDEAGNDSRLAQPEISLVTLLQHFFSKIILNDILLALIKRGTSPTASSLILLMFASALTRTFSRVILHTFR